MSVRDETRWIVEPTFQIFEIVHYVIKFAASHEVNCADPAGYQPYRRIPEFLAKTRAWRYCANRVRPRWQRRQ